MNSSCIANGTSQRPAYTSMNCADDLKFAWTRWLAKYNWQWFVTLTFRYEVHPEAARKLFGVFVHGINQQLFGRHYYRRSRTGIYWVVALEYQKRGVIHFHALLGADRDLNHTLLRYLPPFHPIDVYNRLEGVAGEHRIL